MDSRLEGTWQMMRAEMGGEIAPELVTSHTVVRLVGGRYEVTYGGQLADAGTYQETADAAGLRTLLLRGQEGPNAGRDIPCIIQLMGDRLRVCYGLNGVLPAEFATRAGDERYLATYRRVTGA